MGSILFSITADMAKSSKLVAAKRGKVLLVRRRSDGLWMFPGGRKRARESDKDCLRREIKEELGIDVEAACLAPATFASDRQPGGDRHMVLLLYVCRKWRGTPQSLEGGVVKWVRVQDLYGLQMPGPDRPLIGLLEALL
jgi:8-oxo-dGTP diphosphatase